MIVTIGILLLIATVIAVCAYGLVHRHVALNKLFTPEQVEAQRIMAQQQPFGPGLVHEGEVIRELENEFDARSIFAVQREAEGWVDSVADRYKESVHTILGWDLEELDLGSSIGESNFKVVQLDNGNEQRATMFVISPDGYATEYQCDFIQHDLGESVRHLSLFGSYNMTPRVNDVQATAIACLRNEVQQRLAEIK